MDSGDESKEGYSKNIRPAGKVGRVRGVLLAREVAALDSGLRFALSGMDGLPGAIAAPFGYDNLYSRKQKFDGIQVYPKVVLLRYHSPPIHPFTSPAL